MKIKVYLSIGYSNANHKDEIEIPNEDLIGLSEREKEDFIMKYVNDWANNYIDLGYEEIE